MNRDEKMIVALTGCSHALSHSYLLIFPRSFAPFAKRIFHGVFGLGDHREHYGFCLWIGGSAWGHDL